MPRITKVYTRNGDDGATCLGSGTRVPKTSARLEAYGTVDELNAAIGVVLAQAPSATTAAALGEIQNDLFHLGADLCIPEADKPRCPAPRIEQRHVDRLEVLMDELTAQLPPLENFVLPGGSPTGASLHAARTTCRRAERRAIALAALEPIGPHVTPYLNRLSDALFVMARHQNQHDGVAEQIWNSRA